MRGKRYKTATVSFSGQEELYGEAMRRARAERRSLSNYIRGLIERDLAAAESEAAMHEEPLSYRASASKKDNARRFLDSVKAEGGATAPSRLKGPTEGGQ